ncbi:UDP-N-acetylglucosamine 1-carboxyvinyltransferase [Candidatus Peregrinibacteria bacterium]|nr:UDP-N-acetylglucosamine 1-carboxyvinyltransferase [Candidatus Peregrinibacteria bacterium]
MPKFIVNGGGKLAGNVTVSGSKNAALPILCAAMLTDEKSVLMNVPDIEDVHSMIRILEEFGAEIKFEKNTVTINPAKLKAHRPNEKLIKKMRASILILGALLPRLGEIKMAFPGGCVLGKRSVWAHAHAFKKLGCKIMDEKNGLHLQCKKLRGAKIILPELSVTATENAIMAAVLAAGKTEIHLAAAEPHVQDLCHFINKMGARISGIGSNILTINGVKKLNGAEHGITGDYLEAGTFAIAAVATGSKLNINGINPEHLDVFWQKLEEMGVKISYGKDYITVFPAKELRAIGQVKTAIYPGFPTDLQAPFAVLLTQAKGVSKIFETLFEGRLNYLFELEKMGARVELINPHQALIIGPNELTGMAISSWDIRAGAAMVIAAMIAKGTTEISNIAYIDRGYENLDKKLRSIGAEIKRV